MRPILPLCFMGLAACGEASIGEDTARLCVTQPHPGPGNFRLMALYRVTDIDNHVLLGTTVERIDDQPWVGDRACLTLRPPSRALQAALQPNEIQWNLPALEFYDEGQDTSVWLGAPPYIVRVRAWRIDLVLYEDGNDSGQFETAEPDGSGPDRMVMRLGETYHDLVWVPELHRLLAWREPHEIEGISAHLAPGQRPFVLAYAFSDDVQVWIEDEGPAWTHVSLSEGPRDLPCAPETYLLHCHPDQLIEPDVWHLLLVDPRVPEAHLAEPDPWDYTVYQRTEFRPDAQPELPPWAEPLPPPDPTLVGTCLQYDRYLIVEEARQQAGTFSRENCWCEGWVRQRTAITLADSPPPWLVCEGEVVDVTEGYDETVVRLLDLAAIAADQPWWRP